MLRFTEESHSCLREDLNRAVVKPKEKQSWRRSDFFVLPLERLIILKKEDKGTVDFKLKGYVVVSFSALYYLSSIYVLL